ncbi:UNVERIFIED_CONTAM: hypothetical protein FKN15_004955 [Acipenser sinensis]
MCSTNPFEDAESLEQVSLESMENGGENLDSAEKSGVIGSELTSVPSDSEEPKSPDGPKALLKRSSLGRLSSRLRSGPRKDGEGKQEQLKPVTEDQSAHRILSGSAVCYTAVSGPVPVGPELSVPGDTEENKSPDGSLSPLKRGGLGRLSSKILSGLRKDGDVMEIHDLVNKGVLEEAHLHLLLLKKELDAETSKTVQEGAQSELLRKTKDMELLCGALREKLKSIVKDSLNNAEDLLTDAVKIIVAEDKKEHDPSYCEANCLKGPQEWKELWREAVQEGVRERIASVPIAKREDNQSWLAAHLALLGKSIVDDLGSVKIMVQKCYPQDFGVCDTYVASSHQAVSSHLQKIMQQKLEVNEWYALLNWTINCYESDKIMGNLVLKPEVNTESMDPLLDKDTLENMKTNYSTGLQVQLKHCLENMLNIESEKNWETEDEPEILNGYYHSEIQIDITEMIHRYVATSREIGTDLEERVLCTCSEELKRFSRQFHNTFMEWKTSSSNSALQKMHSIAYINSFSNIKTEMDKYKEKCPAQIEQLNNELDKVIQDFGATLLADFIQETEPYFKKLMTKRWLSCEDDFEKITEIIEHHSELYKKMKQPCFQKCVNDIHYSAVKGYITQIMKKNYSCKNRKHERAAAKIKVESEALRSHFDDMVNSSMQQVFRDVTDSDWRVTTNQGFVLPPLTFEEYLKLRRISEAGQQLISLEEKLYRYADGSENQEVALKEEEELKLAYETFSQDLWTTIAAGVTLSGEELKRLASAMRSIEQEEERDKKCLEEKERNGRIPQWRPRECRKELDTVLQKAVEQRMENILEVMGAENLSSIKQDIFKMGKRVKEDLLSVVMNIKICYPEGYDICNVYAKLYHIAFSSQLKKITEFGLGQEDCAYVLGWVHNYYQRS